MQVVIVIFFADVGFTVGKLFPTTYNCRSLDCAKIVHNCCMTLCTFPFILTEGWALHQMAKNLHGKSDVKGGADGPIVKVLEILVSLAYVVYDVVTKDLPGTDYDIEITTALIVVTCLAEVVLIFQECRTIYKYGGLEVRTVSPEPSLYTRNPKPLTLRV